MNGRCPQCDAAIEFEPLTIRGRTYDFAPLCPRCSNDQKRQVEARKHRETLERTWIELCPPAFRDTIKERLTNPSLLDRVLQWQFGATGLLLHGPSGRGKSRVAWLLLKREHFAGRRCAAIDALSLAAYPSLLMKDQQRAIGWLEHLARVDLLLCDDIFKARLSERCEEAIFLIVDERTQYGRPIVMTTNDTGDSLLDRLSPDRGQPLLRRLRENCETISA